MRKARKTILLQPRKGSIHARAGCKFVVHGPAKISYIEAGCRRITHGLNAKYVNKKQGGGGKRKKTIKQSGSLKNIARSTPKFEANENHPFLAQELRRSRRARRLPKRYQQGGNKKSREDKKDNMRLVEQARLIYQRRYGNPWMKNGYTPYM